jgi:hypothetical protein
VLLEGVLAARLRIWPATLLGDQPAGTNQHRLGVDVAVAVGSSVGTGVLVDVDVGAGVQVGLGVAVGHSERRLHDRRSALGAGLPIVGKTADSRRGARVIRHVSRACPLWRAQGVFLISPVSC